MRRLLPPYFSGTMIAAAPNQGTPAADQYLFKKHPALRASERPWGGSPSYKVRFSWIGCERTGSCPFLQSHSVVGLLPVPVTRLLPPGNDESEEFRGIIPYNFSLEVSDTLNNLFVVRNLLNVYIRAKYMKEYHFPFDCSGYWLHPAYDNLKKIEISSSCR